MIPHFLTKEPLTNNILFTAYQRGYFPMAIEEGTNNIGWFSPEQRMTVDIETPHFSKSLRKICKSQKFEITIDKSFEEVLDHCCGLAGNKRNYGWMAPTIRENFLDFAEQGHAHSIECRQNGELVGGLYGLAIGGIFFGESMFHLVSNASKVAFVHLIARLRAAGFILLDTQIATNHMQQFKLVEYERNHFVSILPEICNLNISFFPPEKDIEQELKDLGCLKD